MTSQHLNDSLRSLVSGMGTDRDKSSSVTYVNPTQDDQQLLAAYRAAWLPKRIIDQPAEDATRKWREWQAEASQISALEATEARLGVSRKVEQALRMADLFGRSHIYIGTDDQDLMEPLGPDRIKRGGLRYLNVFDRRYIAQGEINNDTMSQGFGEPEYYHMTNGARVHPSRLVTFYGAERPDDWVYGKTGDSKLLASLDAIKRHDSTVANVMALVFEARVDVITVPGLADMLQEPDTEQALLERFAMMAQMKGNHGLVMLNASTTPGDPSEEWEQKNSTFTTLPDIIEKAQEEVSAAARIPRAILFGTGAGGLGATGDLELSAYYDRINSTQENEITPAMSMLDECIIRDALGARPPEVWYQWRSLWQMSDKDKAEISTKTTDAMGKFVTALRDAPEWMVESMVNKATETEFLPGLESGYAEWLGNRSDDEGEMI